MGAIRCPGVANRINSSHPSMVTFPTQQIPWALRRVMKITIFSDEYHGPWFRSLLLLRVGFGRPIQRHESYLPQSVSWEAQ